MTDRVAPNPTGKAAAPTEVAAQIALLEAMFGDPGLTRLRKRSPHHPAVKRYDRLVAMRDAPMPQDTEHEMVRAVAEGMMDRSTWTSEPLPDPFWENVVPDAAQRAQVIARIPKADQFGDVMLELYFWGRLRAAGFDVELHEETGLPDIQISLPAGAIWVEVKRIGIGTNPKRVRDVISKASAQIKTASRGRAGVVYILIATEMEAAVFEDRVPVDVEPYVAAAKRTMGSHDDRHAGQVVIAWDDMMVLGHSPEPSMYVVSRRSVALRHSYSVSSPVFRDDELAVGQSMVTWVRYTPSPRPDPLKAIVTPKAVITQAFRQRNAWAGGTRETHALGILKEPHGWEESPVGDNAVVLVTRRIDVGRRPFVVLLIGRRDASGELTLHDAFRLAGTDSELNVMKSRPDVAFRELLRRYGLRVRMGATEGPFIPYVNAPLETPIEALSPTGAHSLWAMIVRREDRIEASWVYAIDDRAYRASVGR